MISIFWRSGFPAQKLPSCSARTCPAAGESEWLKDPAGYNNPAYAADLQFLLSRLHVASVDWIGTSMGGILGMMAANIAPGLIRALVLNDVGCFIPAAAVERIMALADIQTVFTDRAEAEAAFKKRTGGFGINDEAHWRHLLAHGLENAPGGGLRFTYDPAIFFNRPPKDKVTDMNLWPLWEAVTKIPVLLIRGAGSDLLTRETALEMQAKHPNLILREIEGAGHALRALMDKAQIAMIEEWLTIQ